MKRQSKWLLCSYCFTTILCFLLYGLIAVNYNDHITHNANLFIALGIILIGYIPWTIVSGIRHKKRNQNGELLVVATAYAFFLLLVYFGELSKYLNYIAVIR